MGVDLHKRTGDSKTLALQYDAEGKLRHDAVVRHGHAKDKVRNSFRAQACDFVFCFFFLFFASCSLAFNKTRVLGKFFFSRHSCHILFLFRFFSGLSFEGYFL